MFMSLLLNACKELSYGELLSVNGGCVGAPLTQVCTSPTFISYSSSCTGWGVSRTSGDSIYVGIGGGCSSGKNVIIDIKDSLPMGASSGCSGISDSNQNLLKAISDSSTKTYNFGTWDCDIFVESVLKECGKDISKIWGDAKNTDIQGHADNLSNLTTSKPKEGWSVVMMTKSDKYSVNHCGLAYVNSDGSVDFYNNTKSAGHVILEKYNSVSSFQKDFAYSTFDYYKVNL